MKEDLNYYPAAAAEQTFIQRVYQWMAAGLAISGAIAFWASSNIAVLKALAGGGFMVLALVEIGIVFWLSASIQKLSPATALAGFLVYSAINGLTLSYIFVAYTGASIASTFLLAAASFAGVSLFGWLTNTDLSSMGGYLFMALIGVLIATVVNIFLHSEPLYWILTYAGLAVFIGLTAYDTQVLKQIHRNGDGSQQMAVIGALRLYLDFVNMFLLLLRLFGRRK